jgi:hypothetical protein
VKAGDRVMIVALFVNGSDGEGVIVDPYSPITEGKLMVLTEGMRIPLDRGQLVPFVQYWEAKAEERANYCARPLRQ